MTTPTRRIRRLKEPQPVQVRTDAQGRPIAIADAPATNAGPRPPDVMSSSPSVTWTAISLLHRPWRIDQLWWRPGGAVSRRYFRVATADGPPFTLYQDLLSGAWYRQEY